MSQIPSGGPIGRLEVEISANNAKLLEGLEQARNAAASTGTQIEGEAKKTAGAFDTVAQKINESTSGINRFRQSLLRIVGIYGTIVAATSAITSAISRAREEQERKAQAAKEDADSLDKQIQRTRELQDETRKLRIETLKAQGKPIPEEMLAAQQASEIQRRTSPTQQSIREDEARIRELEAERRRIEDDLAKRVVRQARDTGDEFVVSPLSTRERQQRIDRNIAIGIELEQLQLRIRRSQETIDTFTEAVKESQVQVRRTTEAFRSQADSLSGIRVGGSDREVINELRRISRNAAASGRRS